MSALFEDESLFRKLERFLGLIKDKDSSQSDNQTTTADQPMDIEILQDLPPDVKDVLDKAKKTSPQPQAKQDTIDKVIPNPQRPPDKPATTSDVSNLPPEIKDIIKRARDIAADPPPALKTISPDVPPATPSVVTATKPTPDAVPNTPTVSPTTTTNHSSDSKIHDMDSAPKYQGSSPEIDAMEKEADSIYKGSYLGKQRNKGLPHGDRPMGLQMPDVPKLTDQQLIDKVKEIMSSLPPIDKKNFYPGVDRQTLSDVNQLMDLHLFNDRFYFEKIWPLIKDQDPRMLEDPRVLAAFERIMQYVAKRGVQGLIKQNLTPPDQGSDEIYPTFTWKIDEKQYYSDNAQSMFQKLNAGLFEGSLPSNTSVTWFDFPNPTVLGDAQIDYDKVTLKTVPGTQRIRIAEWMLQGVSPEKAELMGAVEMVNRKKKIIATLLHEMVHIWTYLNVSPTEGHGKQFVKKLEEVSAAAGIPAPAMWGDTSKSDRSADSGPAEDPNLKYKRNLQTQGWGIKQ
jgi:hypothetical protein